MPDNPGLRQWLRQHTHGRHVRLNRHPLLTGLTKPGYRIDAYRLLLAAYFHLYQAIETRIEEFLAREASDFDYGRRRKLPWLGADLRFLGVMPFDLPFAPQQPIAIPEVMNCGQLVGLLYTIEGATLGGQVIAKHLASTLALTAGHGACFFNGYGVHTGDFWRQFEAFVESVGRESSLWEPAGLTALTLFSIIEELLDDYQARFNT
ncbi:heme oxygenase (biliverdin-IX-beta and delta-forming) [Gammaproteobacteria bacterium]